MADTKNPTLRPFARRLSKLQKRSFKDSDEDDVYKRAKADLEKLFKDICKAVRADPSLDNVIGADKLLNDLVTYAYDSDAELYDFLPSLAHDDEAGSPLLKDPTTEGVGGIGAGTMESFMRLLQSFKDRDVGGRWKDIDEVPELAQHGSRKVYDPKTKLHEKSTPLAIFRSGQTPGSLSATPLAEAVYQARCEITADRICNPIRLALPSNSSCMALIQAGGWKDREPVLTYFDLDDVTDYNMPRDRTIEVGLDDVAYHLDVDMSERKLLWTADRHRVKSFKIGSTKLNEKARKDWLPKHTLDSKTSGPIVLLNDGATMLRIGKNEVESWNVDGLPDHGESGKEVVGSELPEVDSWMDEDVEIELSSGTKAATTMKFADGFSMEPGQCARMPGGQTSILCSAAERSASCVQYDLGDGRVKVSNRYLGHGGEINAFSTSEGDAQSFLTAANDGIVRLFDVRKPLPKISIDAGADEATDSALYVHVQGVPFVLTGGLKAESIKLWDIRGKAVVYELSTGNNQVHSMAWDATRSTLYAATECFYIDRLGTHHDYRSRKPVKRPRDESDMNIGDEDDEDSEPEDEEDFDDEDLGWPKKAHHVEGNFGYVFDAGYHTLLRYKFGVDPDLTVLPADGEVYPGEENSYW